MSAADSMRRIAPHIGIAGAIAFAVMWPLAVLVTGDWTLGRDTLSELGGKPNLAAPLFNGACIFSGACAILFSSALYAIPKARIGAALFTLASVGLVMVGLFPIDSGDAHMAATVWFFAPMALSVFLLVPAFWKAGGLRLSAVVGICGLAASFLSLAMNTYQFAEAVAVASVIAFGLGAGTQLVLPMKD